MRRAERSTQVAKVVMDPRRLRNVSGSRSWLFKGVSGVQQSPKISIASTPSTSENVGSDGDEALADMLEMEQLPESRA